MSAGAFSRSRYQTDEGEIHPIRVQPETILANVGAANTAPTGSVTQSAFAKVSKGRREYGIGARSVSVIFTATPPVGYKLDQTYRIPILTPTAFSAALVGGTGTYLSTAIEIISKNTEQIR